MTNHDTKSKLLDAVICIMEKLIKEAARESNAEDLVSNVSNKPVL